MVGRRARMQSFMTSANPKSERRKKSRKRPPSLVYVELASANGGMMRDLSEEGFAVRAMMPLRAGEKTPFSFSLNESIRVEGEGEILWIEENGRVAGVQFTQVSPDVHAQIREWLISPEAPPSRDEGRGRAKETATPTLQELLEEMHSVPPRAEQAHSSTSTLSPPVEETASKPAEPKPVEVPPQVPVAASPQIRPSENEEPAPPAATMLQPPESLPPRPPAPALPPLSLRPKGSDPLLHPSASPAGAAHDVMVHGQPSTAAELRTTDERNAESPETARALPDISTVLIQPSGKQTGAVPRSPYPEVSPPWEWESEEPGGKWLERFSLSNAITTMVILALVVGLVVFHRNIGQGFIWIGEELGGTELTASQARASEEAVSNSVQTGSAGNFADRPTQPIPTGNVSSGERDSGLGGTASPQVSLPAAAKNPLPPVAPLSGIAGASAGNGSEAGRDEYLQAMEKLRGKNSDADIPEALRLLWLSVEKGNPSAEVALADMYWHGRGVARNCQQTRVLLTAAARKGSRDAQKRLQQFEQEGCE